MAGYILVKQVGTGDLGPLYEVVSISCVPQCNSSLICEETNAASACVACTWALSGIRGRCVPDQSFKANAMRVDSVVRLCGVKSISTELCRR